MTSVNALTYPVLCLPRKMGVCVGRTPYEIERCEAVVFWRGRFYEGLRLVDANGEAYDVVNAVIT
jgi:hypothetical protein